MKKALFCPSHTLHAKVTIPVAIALAERGYQVDYARKPSEPWSYLKSALLRKPTITQYLSMASLRDVARQAQYGNEFEAVKGKIHTTFFPNYKTYDAIVSTTKDVLELERLQQETGRPCFAIGYQHMPVIMQVGSDRSADPAVSESVFCGDNAFAQDHDFRSIFLGPRRATRLNNFTYLDKVFAQKADLPAPTRQPHALIFHPGGFRGVVSDPGDKRDVCYAKQRDFLTRVCLPIANAGITPIIKIHPLGGKFHLAADVRRLIDQLAKQHPMARHIQVTDEPFWSKAFRAAFILTFGSSTIYEQWSAGLTKTYIANFMGRARSDRFRYFPDIYLETDQDYAQFLKNRWYDKSEPSGLTAEVMRAYSSLFDGQATRHAVERITTV